MIATYLPWLLSAITIWMTVLAGNKHPSAWLIGLANQALWLLWIVMTGTWGLIPMNIALWIVYGRNHLKWQRGESSRIRGSSSPGNPVTLKDPRAERPVEADRPGAAIKDFNSLETCRAGSSGCDAGRRDSPPKQVPQKQER